MPGPTTNTYFESRLPYKAADAVGSAVAGGTRCDTCYDSAAHEAHERGFFEAKMIFAGFGKGELPGQVNSTMTRAQHATVLSRALFDSIWVEADHNARIAEVALLCGLIEHNDSVVAVRRWHALDKLNGLFDPAKQGWQREQAAATITRCLFGEADEGYDRFLEAEAQLIVSQS